MLHFMFYIFTFHSTLRAGCKRLYVTFLTENSAVSGEKRDYFIMKFMKSWTYIC